jgi:hypothetical protein
VLRPDIDRLLLGWLNGAHAAEVLGQFFHLRAAWPQLDDLAQRELAEDALAAIMTDVALPRVKFEQLQQLARW